MYHFSEVLLPSVPWVRSFHINSLKSLFVFHPISLHRKFFESRDPGCSFLSVFTSNKSPWNVLNYWKTPVPRGGLLMVQFHSSAHDRYTVANWSIPILTLENWSPSFSSLHWQPHLGWFLSVLVPWPLSWSGAHVNPKSGIHRAILMHLLRKHLKINWKKCNI